MDYKMLNLTMPVIFVLISGGVIVGAIYFVLHLIQKNKNGELELKAKEAKYEARKAAYDLEVQQCVKEIKELDVLIYQYNMFILSRLGGIRFEQFVGKMLQNLGYTDVVVTKASGDKGGDVIATDPTGIKTCFQCKRYSKEVGISSVQEVFAAASYYECDAAAVITNSSFTAQAIELAGKIGVELWDGECLSGMMEKCKTEVFQLLQEQLKSAKSTANKMHFKDTADMGYKTPFA